MTRSNFISRGFAALAGGLVLAKSERLLAQDHSGHSMPAEPTKSEKPFEYDEPLKVHGYKPVITPNVRDLEFTFEDGYKTFRLSAEVVKHEFAPGMVAECWGYNGSSPGPTIQVVEGDRVRIYVTNRLPEKTSVHWHGVLLPAGMDGVAGLNQKHIMPGETFKYEFVIRQKAATLMYHPHSDEMVQMALGMMGMFIVHAKKPPRRIDRDYAIILQTWDVKPGTARPNPLTMLDFNTFTFNHRAYPGTAPLLAQTNERVRIRIGNLSMDSHPIHLHGHFFNVTGTDGGPIQESAWIPDTTVNVPVGATRDIEFIADNPGDWAFHCHKSHHTMNAMGHDIPNMIGVERDKEHSKSVRRMLPNYMEMSNDGMGQMGEMKMPIPKNTLPMMTGEGPFGPIEMGGMFTVLKIRNRLKGNKDPGWYKYPKGTVASKVDV